jgi:hypothetical protein
MTPEQAREKYCPLCFPEIKGCRAEYCMWWSEGCGVVNKQIVNQANFAAFSELVKQSQELDMGYKE